MVRMRDRSRSGEGRILARPGRPTEAIAPGVHSLGLDARRDALLRVPAGYRLDRPAPLVLSLHGAGGNETSGFYPLGDLADETGMILLSPASRGRTWDVILGGFGPDIAFIDQALAVTFARCAVDSTRIAVAGFSDGASYAVTIGIMNGDLFPEVMAFSPGFAAPVMHHGQPRFYVSHGTRDDVLRIDSTSRRVVPTLADAGYEVTYREFDGGHTVPSAIAHEAVRWLLGEPKENAATVLM